jgi:hypothetical protein
MGVVVARTLAIDFTMICVRIELGITTLMSPAVVLNYWVFVDVFLGTLWAGICVTVLGLAASYLIVHHVSGEWLHLPVTIL